MNNFKKFFTYMVVGALVMALSISCKSNEEPSGPKAGSNPPEGTYTSRTDRLDGTASSEFASVSVTHNGSGCTITGKLQSLKFNSTQSKYEYKGVDVTITVNSWYEGNSYTYSDDFVLSPSGSANHINWGYSADGTAYISLGLFYDDGYSSGCELYYGN